MNSLKLMDDSGMINSKDLCETINIYRGQLEGKAELRHDTLRNIIKDEFEEEILSQYILEKSISSNGGRPISVFILTHNQAKQVLIRESKHVRKAVIKYIDELESKSKLAIAETMNSDQLQLLLSETRKKEEAFLQIEHVKIELDEAIKSKSYISDRKTATAMQKAGALTKVNNRLTAENEVLTEKVKNITAKQIKEYDSNPRRKQIDKMLKKAAFYDEQSDISLLYHKLDMKIWKKHGLNILDAMADLVRLKKNGEPSKQEPNRMHVIGHYDLFEHAYQYACEIAKLS